MPKMGYGTSLVRRDSMRTDGWRRWALGVAVVHLLTGCATATDGTAVAVTDIASVAGRWVGLLEKAGSEDREDFVELTIDKRGVYRAVAVRTVGVMDAQGRMDVVGGGRMRFKGNSGAQGTATLHSQPAQPQRVLVVEGVTATGRHFHARLREN
jgi:hypothetical protein